jgi:fructoselysine 6-kinase
MSEELCVCLGDSCIDTYLPPHHQQFIGGNAINVAVAVQQAGSPAAYAGFIGSDTAGQAVMLALKQKRVDTSQVRVQPGLTRKVFTQIKPNGERQFMHELMAPRQVFRPDPDMLAFVAGQRLAHTNWLSDAETYLPLLHASAGLILSMDYGEFSSSNFIDQTIQQVHLAFFSLPAERADQAQALAQQMFSRGPALVIVTFGYRGSLAYNGQLYFQPAKPVEIVDTLGAGDAYIGSFLGGYLQGKPIQDSMEQAAGAAAQICAINGAWPGAEIEPQDD